MHILDEIINTIQKYSIKNEDIDSKSIELKKLLTDILNIATAQSKTLIDEYLTRQNELEIQIKDDQKNKKVIEDEIKELVDKSSSAESVLISLRQKQSKFNEDLRVLENNKSISDLDSRAISEKITNVRIELNTYEVNLDNSNKKIQQAGLNIQTINFSEYEGKSLDDIENKLTELETKIIKLGAINLAAPEEIKEESKRKEELDEQYEDLTEALDKLTSAIKKIDQETKTIFKDSFDAVNMKLKEMFPKLFGGGMAELTLTDENELNAGVILMARPPGKKNSSISQFLEVKKHLQHWL